MMRDTLINRYLSSFYRKSGVSLILLAFHKIPAWGRKLDDNSY